MLLLLIGEQEMTWFQVVLSIVAGMMSLFLNLILVYRVEK